MVELWMFHFPVSVGESVWVQVKQQVFQIALTGSRMNRQKTRVPGLVTHTIFAYRTPLHTEFNMLPVRVMCICRFQIQLPFPMCSVTRCLCLKCTKEMPERSGTPGKPIVPDPRQYLQNPNILMNISFSHQNYNFYDRIEYWVV